jgi:hypothetical protein
VTLKSSHYNGRAINPPDSPKRTNNRASQEEKDYAVYLHKEGGLHGEWRAIARRVFRKFGNDRTHSSVRLWVLNHEAGK